MDAERGLCCARGTRTRTNLPYKDGIVVIGEADVSGVALSSIEGFFLQPAAMQALPTMRHSRIGLGVCTWKGKVIVATGSFTQSNPAWYLRTKPLKYPLQTIVPLH